VVSLLITPSRPPLSFSPLSLTILLSATTLFDRTSPHPHHWFHWLSLSVLALSTLKPRFQFLRFWSCMSDIFHEIESLDDNKLR
jgi:hypothetical protein